MTVLPFPARSKPSPGETARETAQAAQLGLFAEEVPAEVVPRPRSSAVVTAEAALASLKELAEQAGIVVRVEAFPLRPLFNAIDGKAGKGGLCRVGGKTVILIDCNVGPVEQAGIIAEALRRLGVAGAPLSMHAFLKKGHGKVRPLASVESSGRRPRAR